MSIEVGLWRLDGEKANIVEFTAIDTERRLEDILAKDISILNRELLLAIDGVGNLVVIELKRNRTPRDVIAQLLDYGSWVRDLEDDDVASIFDDYLKKLSNDKNDTSLDQAFCEKFAVKQMPETINDSHELVVIAGMLDDSTERIINYLAEEYGVAINAVFFRFFKDDEIEYISRAWMIDPGEAEAKVIEKREKLPWNGEYYVSFGGDENRDWEEARRYGFVSAGGGSWYTKSLGMLEKGVRIWVNMPGGIGYVGVGEVVNKAVPIDNFCVKDDDGKEVPISTLSLKAAKLCSAAKDSERAEHVVRVRWIKTVPVKEAIREKGFFGNQNSAAKPRAKKWQHTVDRLKKRFGIE